MNEPEIHYQDPRVPPVFTPKIEPEPLFPDALPPYREGTYSQRNTGEACWSCAGLGDHAPGERCIYPENHRRKP